MLGAAGAMLQSSEHQAKGGNIAVRARTRKVLWKTMSVRIWTSTRYHEKTLIYIHTMQCGYNINIMDIVFIVKRISGHVRRELHNITHNHGKNRPKRSTTLLLSLSYGFP